MPLFKCSECGCIDNTACGGDRWMTDKDTAKCSECFTGEWLAPFPKKTPEEMNLEVGKSVHDQVGGWYATKKDNTHENM